MKLHHLQRTSVLFILLLGLLFPFGAFAADEIEMTIWVNNWQ